MRRDQQRLEDILEALDALANLIADRTEEEFLRDDTLRYNVAWRLLVVGEAGARISAVARRSPKSFGLSSHRKPAELCLLY